MSILHPMSILDSFSIKSIFYDKMCLRLFYFHVMICPSLISSTMSRFLLLLWKCFVLKYWKISQKPPTSASGYIECLWSAPGRVKLLLLIIIGVFIVFIAAGNQLWVGQRCAIRIVLPDSLRNLSITDQIKLNRGKQQLKWIPGH